MSAPIPQKIYMSAPLYLMRNILVHIFIVFLIILLFCFLSCKANDNMNMKEDERVIDSKTTSFSPIGLGNDIDILSKPPLTLHHGRGLNPCCISLSFFCWNMLY